MQPERIREVHTRDEILEWYKTADENDDGKLSVNEFFTWYPPTGKPCTGPGSLRSIDPPSAHSSRIRAPAGKGRSTARRWAARPFSRRCSNATTPTRAARSASTSLRRWPTTWGLGTWRMRPSPCSTATAVVASLTGRCRRAGCPLTCFPAYLPSAPLITSLSRLARAPIAICTTHYLPFSPRPRSNRHYRPSLTFAPRQVLSALKTNVPHNMETKKLLFGSIWTWGCNEEYQGNASRPQTLPLTSRKPDLALQRYVISRLCPSPLRNRARTQGGHAQVAHPRSGDAPSL